MITIALLSSSKTSSSANKQTTTILSYPPCHLDTLTAASLAAHTDAVAYANTDAAAYANADAAEAYAESEAGSIDDYAMRL